MKGTQMKRRSTAVMALVGVLLLATGCTAEEKKAEVKNLETLKDKVSYAIGLDIGKDFKQQGMDIEPSLVAKGIQDSVTGAQPLLTDQQVQETIQAFQKELMAKQEAKQKEAAEKNIKEGQAFLDENGKKEGVVTLPSGLQYKVNQEGTGPMPGPNDTVKVHYEGKLVDGTVFDSSLKRGEPATFPVTGVIPGWTEALQKMKQGSKWTIVIPPALAYGERGAGPIGPNSVLIFDVELLEVMPGSGAPQGKPQAKPQPKAQESKPQQQ
jgi:FKBP-type peptidyl-prolyl cis-trans isomerase FklB